MIMICISLIISDVKHLFMLSIFSYCPSVNLLWAFLMSQLVKNLPAMWKTWIQSLGWEDPLEKGMATHSSNVAWRIPMDRGAWWATVHRVAKSRTRLSDYAQTSCFKCTVERFSGDLPSHTTTSLPYSFRTFPFPQKGPLDVFL